MTGSASQDPRWSKLHDREWTCPNCGEEHIGIIELALDHPDFWQGETERRPNSEIRSSNHISTEDFCIIEGEHFFVRCVLNLPIIDHPGHDFGYGVWTTLSKKNFELYLDTFDTGDQGNLGPWFGWFSNRLPGYPDTLNLKCQIHPRNGRQRPHIELEPTDHPLAIEQREGITFDRLLEIYGLNGHDIRDALTES